MTELDNSNSNRRIWDSSIIIALIAVLISSVSAYISLKESRIMMAQQELLAEQQEASVWPYLENTNIIDYQRDTSVIFQFVVTNKGVGPAIIDSVIYLFDERPISGWGLAEVLREKYPSMKFNQTSNATLDYMVLAPGEKRLVISVRITKSKNDKTKLSSVLSDFDYQLQYCYCSVYGKCWRVYDKDTTKPSATCVFRSDIR